MRLLSGATHIKACQALVEVRTRQRLTEARQSPVRVISLGGDRGRGRSMSAVLRSRRNFVRRSERRQVPEAVILLLIDASVMSDKTRHFPTIKIGQQNVSRSIGKLRVHFISRPTNM